MDEQLRLVPALLPVAHDVPHRPVRPQPHRDGERRRRRAATRSSCRRRRTRCPVWLRAAGYHTVHIGKYLNGYGQPAPDRGAAGLGRVVRLGRSEHVPLLRLHAEREREARELREQARRLSGGRLHGQGGRRSQAPRSAAGAVLPLGRVPRPACGHAARVRRSGKPRHARPGAASPQPLRGRADAAHARVQRGRRVRQAGRDPAAPSLRGRPHRRDHGELPPAPRVAARSRRGRRRDRPRAAGQRRARSDALRFHIRQRFLPRRASGRERQGAASTSRRYVCRW